MEYGGINRELLLLLEKNRVEAWPFFLDSSRSQRSKGRYKNDGEPDHGRIRRSFFLLLFFWRRDAKGHYSTLPPRCYNSLGRSSVGSPSPQTVYYVGQGWCIQRARSALPLYTVRVPIATDRARLLHLLLLLSSPLFPGVPFLRSAARLPGVFSAANGNEKFEIPGESIRISIDETFELSSITLRSNRNCLGRLSFPIASCCSP